ncbi:MAG TPA: HNH endonuclease [Bacteriovoracaceae bacterium]|nr:HNH endonuclease [Bacteriovoracaceae bacterium]
MSLLAERERAILCEVLWHLREIDNRNLYAESKCSSLYDYCITVLKYSEGQASRRVNACRMLISVPEIAKDIETGALNITLLNQAKYFFDEEKIKSAPEKRKVLELIKGKTTRQSEKILWELKKEEAPRKVNLSLLEETVEGLKKLKALKGHSCPDMDSLIRKMTEELNSLWDPATVIRNRKKTNGDTRYVQVAVKAEVWTRDKGKCSKCGSTFALELDHVKPVGVGGKTTVENLRLMCRSCNQRLGKEFFKNRSQFC